MEHEGVIRTKEIKFTEKYDDSNGFTCLEVHIKNNSEYFKRIEAYARRLSDAVNPGQANTSKKRDNEIIYINNLSGQIAETTCERILKYYLGDKNVYRPESDTSKNQIDIKLINNKSIEVRSSCIRNGIEFALFQKDKNNSEQQYVDVIGPYRNEYKNNEQYKDYYMRALFICDTKDFLQFISQDTISFYITGGATGDMMKDPKYYQSKHLSPKGGQVVIESDYDVIPLGKSLDFPKFINILKEEKFII